MKNILIVFILLIVFGVGGYYLINKQTVQEPKTIERTVLPTERTQEAITEKKAPKEFTLDSFEFGYDKKILTVSKGDTVSITLTNSGKMMHDWVVDEFAGAQTKQIKNGETDTITFVADTAGQYEFYCSVGAHRANGMVGKLIVE